MAKSELKTVIMELVEMRGSSKTICPSEAARSYADGDNWREWMEPVRNAAHELYREHRIQIEQYGKPIDPDNIRGPIRLRLKESRDE